MITSENLAQISPALVKAQSEIKGITKNAQGHGYKYITIDAILELVRPVLSTNGLCLIQNIQGELNGETNLASCETRILHESGEWMQSDKLVIKPVPTASKNNPNPVANPRDLGSAITYAKRYQLCGMLGINADVDDDAAVASNKQDWGLLMTADQKHNISQVLIPQKGINKVSFNELMIKEIGSVKEFGKFTKDEAAKVIKAMMTMPDKKQEELPKAQ